MREQDNDSNSTINHSFIKDELETEYGVNINSLKADRDCISGDNELIEDSIEEKQGMQTLPIMSHLVELRSRLIKVLATFILVFMLLLTKSQKIYEFVALPLVAELPQNATMIFINPTGSFVSTIKVTLYVTLLVIIPIIFHQMWGFVAPALYKHEKKLVLPMIIGSTLLFYTGISFAYNLLTNVLRFLINFAPENVIAMPDIERYLNFVLQIFLAFGLAFEIPMITLLLILSGVVKTSWLEEKRPFIIVACFGIAAIITPPDGWSMVLLAVPMCLLFEFGLLLGKAFYNKKQL